MQICCLIWLMLLFQSLFFILHFAHVNVCACVNARQRFFPIEYFQQLLFTRQKLLLIYCVEFDSVSNSFCVEIFSGYSDPTRHREYESHRMTVFLQQILFFPFSITFDSNQFSWSFSDEDLNVRRLDLIQQKMPINQFGYGTNTTAPQRHFDQSDSSSSEQLRVANGNSEISASRSFRIKPNEVSQM